MKTQRKQCQALIPVPDQSARKEPDRVQCSYFAKPGSDLCGVHGSKSGVVTLKDAVTRGLRESGGAFIFVASMVLASCGPATSSEDAAQSAISGAVQGAVRK